MLSCSYWDTAFVYVFAELFGAVIAAALVLPLYGFGQFGSLFDTRIFKTFGLSIPKHLAQVQHLPKKFLTQATASAVTLSILAP